MKLRRLSQERSETPCAEYDAEFADELKLMKYRLRDAETELNKAMSQATHPWEGKKVKGVVSKRGSSPFHFRDVEVSGIVEVRREETKFAANIKYGLPDYGEAFVRLLKEDGTPSLKYVKCSWYETLEKKWKLVEEEGNAYSTSACTCSFTRLRTNHPMAPIQREAPVRKEPSARRETQKSNEAPPASLFPKGDPFYNFRADEVDWLHSDDEIQEKTNQLKRKSK